MSVESQLCSLAVSDLASPEVYTDVAGVTGFQGPSGSRQVIDATTLADTAKVKRVGIPDYGQLSVDFVFDSGDPELVDLWDAFISGVSQNFKLYFSDSPRTTFTYSGYVLAFNYSASVDEIVRGSLTIEITGAITDNLA